MWQTTADRESFARQERTGIGFLKTLGPLSAELTQAQSVSVAGGTFDGPGLTSAIATVADADARLGDTLRTHERWADLRGKIEGLVTKKPASGQPAYEAYGEVTDLLLALYGTVRENSGLIRDPAADGYYLQDGVAQELPEFLVTMGRFTDLVSIVSRLPVDNRTVQLAQLYAAQNTVNSPAQDLTDDLQAAVSASESPTLGANLFKLLDRLRQAMDAVSSTTILADADITPVDVNAVTALRSHAVDAVNPLYAIALDELDKLIVVRLDQTSIDRELAIGAAAVAVVIALLPALSLGLGGLGRRGAQAPPGRHGRPEPEADEEPQASPPQGYPAWSATGPDGITSLRERERSGAAR